MTRLAYSGTSIQAMAVSIAKTVKAVAACLPPIIAVPRAVSAHSALASTVAMAPVWLTEYVVAKTFHLPGSSPLTILVTHLYIELGESDLASAASLIIIGGGAHHLWHTHHCLVVSGSGYYMYAGLWTSPGKLVKISP